MLVPKSNAMPNPPRDIPGTFPRLAALFNADRFRRDIEMLESLYGSDRKLLTRQQKGYSRGFWNTCLLARVAPGEIATAALWRLQIVELGLEAAARVGKETKFRPILATDESGFDQAIAELFVVGALCKGIPNVDFERPGSAPGKNYDIHLEPGNQTELHIDVKWRTESPTGEAHTEVLPDLSDLLAGEVNRSVFVQLRSNLPTGEEKLRDACAIVDALALIRSGAPGPLVTDANRSALPTHLQALSLDLAFKTEPCHSVSIGGIDALYVPSNESFLLADRAIESLEFGSCGTEIVIIPKSETRPVFSNQCRSALVIDSPQGLPLDHKNPESSGIAALLRSLYRQLPNSPVNIAAFIHTHASFKRRADVHIPNKVLRKSDGNPSRGSAGHCGASSCHRVALRDHSSHGQRPSVGRPDQRQLETGASKVVVVDQRPSCTVSEVAWLRCENPRAHDEEHFAVVAQLSATQHEPCTLLLQHLERRDAVYP